MIELDILDDTNEIVCNAKNLCIESVSVDEKKLDDSAVQLDDVNERLILRLGKPLKYKNRGGMYSAHRTGTLSRFCIGSLQIANSVGNINTTESLQNRKQFASYT